MICNACGDIGTINLGEGYVLCSRCEEIFAREFPRLSAKLNSCIAVEASSGSKAVAPIQPPSSGATADFPDLPVFLRRKREAA